MCVGGKDVAENKLLSCIAKRLCKKRVWLCKRQIWHQVEKGFNRKTGSF